MVVVSVSHNFYLAAQHSHKTHQQVDRETTKPAGQHNRNLGLVDPQPAGGFSLGQSLPLDQSGNLTNQFCFGLLFFGIGLA